MNMSYFFTIIFFILMSLEIYIFFKDILSPAFIYSCAMTLGIICSFIGRLYWNNVSELHIVTILILILSAVSFFLGELIARLIMKKIGLKDKYEFKGIFNIPIWKNILEVIFIIITIGLLYSEVKRIATIDGLPYSSFGEMVNKYRDLSILNTTELIQNGQGINIVVAQMKKVCEVLAFINIFFLANNIINEDKFKRINVMYILIVGLNCVLPILIAERMQIAIYLLSFIITITILALRKMKIKEFLKEYLKKIIILIICGIVIFFLMIPIVGKKLDSNIISYISFYFGSQIPSLDRYLQEEHEPPKYFGQETLRGINTVAYRLHLSQNIEPMSTEWQFFEVNSDKIYRSNIFTSAKRYYHDFGWIGIIICQCVFGLIFSIIYLLIFKVKRPVLLIFYISYFYMIVDQIRDDLFYSNFIHVNSILRFILIWIMFIACVADFSSLKKGIIGKWKKEEQTNQ